uniref:BfmS n=1 Tax=Ganoderma boninense TaxID=34458 RepID=A0A5K1JW29_9APHY|nr:BfmS [Ganoderma boninense]
MAQPPSEDTPYSFTVRVLRRPSVVTVLRDGAPASPDVIGVPLTITRRFYDEPSWEEDDSTDEESSQTDHVTVSASPPRRSRSATLLRASTPIPSAGPDSKVNASGMRSRQTTPAPGPTRTSDSSGTSGTPLTTAGSRQGTPAPSESGRAPQRTPNPLSSDLPSLDQLAPQIKSRRITRSTSRSSLTVESCEQRPSGSTPADSAGKSYRNDPVMYDDDDDFSQYERISKKCLQTAEEKRTDVKFTTSWFYSEAGYSLSAPPSGMTSHPRLAVGDLFFHVVTHLEEPQMWMWLQSSNGKRSWKAVVKGDSRRIDNRRLTVSWDPKKGVQKPVWVTDTWYKKTWESGAAKGKGRGRDNSNPIPFPSVQTHRRRRALFFLHLDLASSVTLTLHDNGFFEEEGTSTSSTASVHVHWEEPHDAEHSQEQEQEPEAAIVNAESRIMYPTTRGSSSCCSRSLNYALVAVIAAILGLIFMHGLNFDVQQNFPSLSLPIHAVHDFIQRPVKLSPQMRDQINSVIREAVATQIGRRDYALAADGGSIYPSLTSGPSALPGISKSHPAEVILRDNLQGGRCWTIVGARGQVALRVATRMHPTHITIDQVPAEVSEDPRQGPRRMRLWGAVDGNRNQDLYRRYKPSAPSSIPDGPPVSKGYTFLHLSDFQYELDAVNNVQTFPVKAQVQDLMMDFGVFVVEVLDNWGSDSTCICRIRLHGRSLS